MKLIWKRTLFWLFLVISVACFLAGLSVLTPVWEVYFSSLTRAYALLFDLIFIFATYFLGKYGSDRRKTRDFFYKNQALLDPALDQLSGYPIARIASSAGAKPGALRKNGLFVLPEAGASEAELDRAAAIGAALYDELKQREIASYPDYSETSLALCIRKKSPRVWTLQVKSGGWGAKQTLFFSPDGKTWELKSLTFFPPKKLTERWFV